MSSNIRQEIASFATPPALAIYPAPTIGKRAPSHEKLMPIPRPNGKPIIISFLRHCGCPFAEKIFKNLADLSLQYPEVDFYAISHSSVADTNDWAVAIGVRSKVNIIVDEKRELYALWGLGISNTWHVLNPWSMLQVLKLGLTEHIWNRPTVSGNRWQIAGSWAVDRFGRVKWGRKARSIDDIPNIKKALMRITS